MDAFPSSKEDSFPSLLRAECHIAGMSLRGGHDSVAMALKPCAQVGLPHSQANQSNFQMSQLFVSSGQVLEFQVQY